MTEAMTPEQLEEIRGRTAFYRDWAKDAYESNVYGIDDRRDLVAEVDRLRAGVSGLRHALERVAALYHYKADRIDHRSGDDVYYPEDWRNDCQSPVCAEARNALEIE